MSFLSDEFCCKGYLVLTKTYKWNFICWTCTFVDVNNRIYILSEVSMTIIVSLMLLKLLCYNRTNSNGIYIIFNTMPFPVLEFSLLVIFLKSLTTSSGLLSSNKLVNSLFFLMSSRLRRFVLHELVVILCTVILFHHRFWGNRNLMFMTAYDIHLLSLYQHEEHRFWTVDSAGSKLILDEFFILLPVSDSLVPSFFCVHCFLSHKVIKCVPHNIGCCTCNMNMMASGLTVMGPLLSFK